MTIVSRISARSDPRMAVARLDEQRYPSAERTVMASRATGLWESLVNAIAPMGYEDETGFHFGLQGIAKTSPN